MNKGLFSQANYSKRAKAKAMPKTTKDLTSDAASESLDEGVRDEDGLLVLEGAFTSEGEVEVEGALEPVGSNTKNY